MLASNNAYGIINGGFISMLGMLTRVCLYSEKLDSARMYAFPSIVRAGEPPDLNMIFTCWYDRGESEWNARTRILRLTKRCGLILTSTDGRQDQYERIGLIAFVRGEVDWFEDCIEEVITIV